MYVYKLTNKVNNKIYVGVTNNISRKMWAGQTWKHIMPEVFEELKQRTSTEEEVIRYRKLKKEGYNPKKLWEKELSQRIKFHSFMEMWNGKNWKHLLQ